MASLSDLLFGGGAPTDIPPVVPSLPSRLQSLQTKYTTRLPLSQLQSQFGPDIVNSLVKFETDRANRGVAPLSTQKTLDILKTAKSGKAVTSAPTRDPLDFFGNIASDVGTIVSSIPKLPMTLFNEVKQLPEIPKDLAKAKGIGDYLSLPGVRLLPGAYTAKNLLTGNFSEALSHPVMTALDVAPYAGALGAGEKLAGIGVGDTTVGELADRAKAAAGRTYPGRIVRQLWGSSTRGMMRILGEHANELSYSANPALSDIYTKPLDQITQEGTRAATEYAKVVGFDTPRDNEIWNALQQGTLHTLDLTPEESAAVTHINQVRDQFLQTNLDANELQRRVVQGSPEIITNAQAKPLDKLTAKIANSQLVTDLHRNILDPTIRPVSDLLSRASDTILNEATKAPLRKTVAQGLLHSLDAAGYDIPPELQSLATKVTKKTNTAFMDQVNAVASATPGELRPVAYSAESAKALAPEDLSSPAQAQRWLNQTKGQSTQLVRASEKLAATESRTVPARWQPIVADLKQTKIRDFLDQRLSPDDPRLPEVMNFVAERNYGALEQYKNGDANLIDMKQIKQYQNEAAANIADLKAQGINPEYVHHVSIEAAKQLQRPSLSSIIPKPSILKDRINDWTPTNQSLSVSITHQGLELGKEAAVQAALPVIRDTYGATLAQVRDELLPIARRMAARSGGGPEEVAANLESLLKKTYVQWSETEKGFMAGVARSPKASTFAALPDDAILFPRHLADSLDKLSTPSPLSHILDPATRLFRYAVLPFSPRFQLNHLGGGMVFGLFEDPRMALELGKAIKVAKDWRGVNRALAAGKDATLDETSAATIAALPQGVRAQLGSLELSANPDYAFKLRAGNQMGDLLTQTIVPGMKRFGRTIENAADYSFGLASFSHDVYTLASYFSGEKTALRKGLTPEAAAAAGETLANKIVPQWLEMTPMERSILRPFIPFYSFMTHVVKYAMDYPIDHPWRTAVIGGLSRAEIQDFGTGLPQALASAFFLGSPNSSGNQTIIDIHGLNPFRNLGDDLTLAGFMSNINPAFKVALQQLGYDPVAKGANIYPEVVYDPKTGGFKAAPTNTPGLAGQLIGAFLPQAQTVAALLGTSSTFKDLMRTNPEAAQRMLASQLGIPLLWRNINTYQDAFKAEINRQTAQQTALSAALKTGDYTDAARFPSLAPKLAALQTQASAGALAKYQPSATAAQAQIRWDQG